MFSIRAPINAPSLTYGKVLKGMDAKEIQRVIIRPNDSVSLIENKDGTTAQASIVANEYFVKKADKNDVELVIAQPEVTNVPSISDIFSILLFAVFAYSAVTMVRNGGPVNQITNTFTFETVEETGVTFDDVAGIDEAKDELTEIVQFLKYPSRFEDIGAKIPRGFLLSGPPGTGKTLLAKAIAGEAGVPFVAVSASQFVELFVGLGASRIRSLFTQARENKPCIIFIDEIDAIGKSRSGSVAVSGGNDEREQTLNQLLLEMDGFKDNKGIIVVGATNRPEILDQALLRPGRFDRKVAVDLPDREGREKILRVHASNKQLDCAVDLDTVARLTMGASGAELENILNEAAILAARGSRKRITNTDINEAIDKVTIGLKKNRKVSDKTRRVVAYHEAGHALMGYLVEGPESIQKVSIIPRGSTGGVTVFVPPDDTLVSKQYLMNRIMIGLGGTVAEECMFGNDNITTGASGDIEQITKIATSMVRNYGFSTIGKFRSSDEKEINTEVGNIIEEAYKNTQTYISTYRDKLDAIANLLLEKETISQKEFLSLFNSE